MAEPTHTMGQEFQVQRDITKMRKCEKGLILNSVLFMLLMGTFPEIYVASPLTKFKPEHAKYKEDPKETAELAVFRNRELGSPVSSTLPNPKMIERYEEQTERPAVGAVIDGEIFAWSQRRKDTGPAKLTPPQEVQGPRHQSRKRAAGAVEDLEIYGGSKRRKGTRPDSFTLPREAESHNREMTHNQLNAFDVNAEAWGRGDSMDAARKYTLDAHYTDAKTDMGRMKNTNEDRPSILQEQESDKFEEIQNKIEIKGQKRSGRKSHYQTSKKRRNVEVNVEQGEEGAPNIMVRTDAESGIDRTKLMKEDQSATSHEAKQNTLEGSQGTFRTHVATHELAEDHAAEMKLGQNSGKETVDTREVNGEQGENGVSNIMKSTVGRSDVSRRKMMNEDPRLTSEEMRLDTLEGSQRYGYAMAKSAKMTVDHDAEANHNRQRRKKYLRLLREKRKAKDGNSGRDNGTESDTVHSTPAGTEVRTPKLMDNTEGECRKIYLPVAIIMSFLGGVLAAFVVICCCLKRRYCQQGYERPASEEDISRNMTPILEGCTDLKLYRITEVHRVRLESLTEDVVENISETLLKGNVITELNHEEIRKLTRSDRRQDASKLLLKSVLDRNFWECRMFCRELAKMQEKQQSLISVLEQSVEEETVLQHRYTLRIQSKKLRDACTQGNKMPKSRLIDDIYTDPKITRPQPEHDSRTGESKKHVREFKTHELLRIINTDSEKNTIAVVCGAAGTGKSTMIQKIIHDWATKNKQENFKFVFHFKVHNLNAKKCGITLNTLILDQYPYLEDFLEKLWKEPKSILFIFDDLDQLDRPVIFSENEKNIDPRHHCLGPESYCFVSDIVQSLIQGDLLKGCSVLFTIQPFKLDPLCQLTLDSTFQIGVFNSEKAKEYFRRYFRGNLYANDILEFIEQSDILWKMCDNPLFCLVLASSLESRQSEADAQTPIPTISHTWLLSDYVMLLLERCGYDQKTSLKSLLELGELAYERMAGKTLPSEVDTLGTLNSCSPRLITAVMIQAPDKESDGDIYEFRNSVMQNFLAALSKRLNTPGIGLKGLLDEALMVTDGRLNTFSRFLLGLVSRKLTARLELEFGSFPSDATSVITQWLTEDVKRRLPNLEGKYYQSMFLNILHYLLEFGDTRVTRDVLEPIRTIKFNQCLLKPSDCVVLSRTLIHSEVIEELDLSSCLIQQKRLQQLDPLLRRCQILRLNENDLQDSGVRSLFNILNINACKIQTLELRSNHLTDDCLDGLFSALSTNCSLTQLYLSNSIQDEQHANRFTDEVLQKLVDRSAPQKQIRWLHNQDIGQDIAASSTASNVLTVITD
ncbi:uncharacterized protein LOC127566669 isoform X2 [Pristis pectinata]|uniref:uncharacterized protein LOC127566669 isoform X2 n=1 Tax=Pristis pectinata TaxID=685728 RepID=UPI00223D04C4|nr:uncharacterized protein LOC127566669 isoform X2 [Pristis pectinata]